MDNSPCGHSPLRLSVNDLTIDSNRNPVMLKLANQMPKKKDLINLSRSHLDGY